MSLFGPPNVGKLKAKYDVEGLIKALNYQKDNDVRCDAAEALGIIGDARAMEPLIAALKDSYLSVRRKAAIALGEIGDARAVEPLIAALKDSDRFVRWNAAEALGKIGDARAVEPLIAALKDSDKYVRREAAEALGKIGDARAVESLIAALKDSDKYVRREAAEALGKIGAPTVEPLIAALKDDDKGMRMWAIGALRVFDNPRAIAACKEYDELAKAIVMTPEDKYEETRMIKIYYCQNCGENKAHRVSLSGRTYTFCSSPCQESFGQKLYRLQQGGMIRDIERSAGAFIGSRMSSSGLTKYCQWCGSRLDISTEICGECSGKQE